MLKHCQNQAAVAQSIIIRIIDVYACWSHSSHTLTHLDVDTVRCSIVPLGPVQNVRDIEQAVRFTWPSYGLETSMTMRL